MGMPVSVDMKEATLQIAVADDEPVMRMYLQETVSGFGHNVMSVAKDGVELMENCSKRRPDLIITDIRMPRLDGFQAVREICRESPVPVVFVTGYNEWFKAAEVERDCVLVYLVKPVGEVDLRLAIDLVMQRFQQFRVLLQEDGNLQNALVDRQYVERAKTLLVKWQGLSDRQAFEHIRRLASEKGLSTAATAKDLLESHGF